MYDNSEYATSRLAGTIVRLLDGRPVTVSGCHGRDDNIQVEYNYLGNGRGGSNVALSEIDLTPVTLGWSEHSRRDSAYLVRIPKSSDYRQGLRSSNYISVFGCDKRYINSSRLSQTILGVYMSFELALDEASNSNKVTSFCRTFAVKPKRSGPNFELYFKWFGVVGDIVQGKPQLSGNFDHLQQSLESVLQ